MTSYLFASVYGSTLLAILAMSFFVVSRYSHNIKSSRLWAVSFASFSVAMGLSFYRGLGNEDHLTIALLNLLMYVAMIIDYVAVCIWVRKRINFMLMYTITAMVFLFHLYYLLIEDNILLRIFLIRGFFMIMSFSCFYQIASSKVERNIGHKLAAIFLLLLGLVNAVAFFGFLSTYHDAQLVAHEEFYNMLSTTVILSASPTLFSAAGIFYLLGLLLEKIKTEQDNAQQDPLTGAKNRRGFDLIFNSELVRSKRTKQAFSLAILDIDHFKKINDTYGHKVGDKILIKLCKHLKSHLRELDCVCRLGGEEFLILLTNCELESAYQIIERIREDLQAQVFIRKHPKLRVTASFGLCLADPQTDDLDSLYKRCDALLYQAKHSGRNQTIKEETNDTQE